MSLHVILTLSLKPVPILEINNNKTGGSGKLSDLPKYPQLVSYRCVTNYHQFSSLKQHKCIKSSVLCITSWVQAQVVWVLCSETKVFAGGGR